MHIQYTDLPEPRSLPEGTTLEYGTQDQDCRSLERFAIRTLNAGMRTPEILDESRESFWIIISGEGTMTRGDETTQIRPRDLIITPPGVPHSLTAGGTPVKWFDVAFHSATWGLLRMRWEMGSEIRTAIISKASHHWFGVKSCLHKRGIPATGIHTLDRIRRWIIGIRIAVSREHAPPTMSTTAMRSFGTSTKVQGMSSKTGKSLRSRRAISSDMRRVSIIRLSLGRSRSVGTVSV